MKPFLDYTQLFDKLKIVAWGSLPVSSCMGVIRLTVRLEHVDLHDRSAVSNCHRPPLCSARVDIADH